MKLSILFNKQVHGLRTPREEIALTAQPKIQSQPQIFWYGRSIFFLPHRPNFSDICDLCLHWVSVVRVCGCVVALNFRTRTSFHAAVLGLRKPRAHAVHALISFVKVL